jgi:transcription initiation factor TFIIE subunit beta
LASEGRILVVKNKDGAPRVLFWNDQRYNTAMDQGSLLANTICDYFML